MFLSNKQVFCTVLSFEQAFGLLLKIPVLFLSDINELTSENRGFPYDTKSIFPLTATSAF